MQESNERSMLFSMGSTSYLKKKQTIDFLTEVVLKEPVFRNTGFNRFLYLQWMFINIVYRILYIIIL